MEELTWQELDKLIYATNLLDTKENILWIIRDSKSLDIQTDEILEVLDVNGRESLEKLSEELKEHQTFLYEYCKGSPPSVVDYVIRNVNPGMMRANLREIYKERCRLLGV